MNKFMAKSRFVVEAVKFNGNNSEDIVKAGFSVLTTITERNDGTRSELLPEKEVYVYCADAKVKLQSRDVVCRLPDGFTVVLFEDSFNMLFEVLKKEDVRCETCKHDNTNSFPAECVIEEYDHHTGQCLNWEPKK